MLCRTVQGAYPHIVTSGLCHSVQGTASMLAKWIGAPEDEISYTCAGVNHQAFYIDFKWNGEDAIPLIRKAITEREEVYNEEIVRNEMFLALGYYVTESSGHNSEYNAWFRKRQDLIEKYCLPGTGWNPGEYAYILNEYRRRETEWKQDIEKWVSEPLDLARGKEYASSIFNAIFGDHEMFKFNGNVRNFGLIDNLPADACVEVPCLIDRMGVNPCHVGRLPVQLAAMNMTNINVQLMTIEAARTRKREDIYRPAMLDPHTAAELSIDDIVKMCDELIEAHGPYMAMYK